MCKTTKNTNYYKDFESKDNKKVYIYIDSTLPFTILKRIVYKKNFVLLSRKKHLIKILNKYYIKENKAINLSSLFTLKIFFILLKIKFFNEKVIFFHECCNPIFDTFVNLFCIKGAYFPIAAPLKVFKSYNYFPYQIKSLSIYKKILYFIFNFFLKNFLFYLRIDPQKKTHVYFVIKKYHRQISINNININNSSNVKTPKKKILIFLSKINPYNNVDYTKESIKCFIKILNYCKRNKIKVYIKNHPNKSSRINLKNKYIINILPDKPAELIDYNEYDFFISLCSMSLISFPGKAISIASLFTNNRKIASHYKNFFPDAYLKKIKFPRTYNEMFKIVKKKYKL